jgi:hypothetical protein
MTPRDGDDLDGAVGTTEAGGIVDFGNVSAPPIAENFHRLQAADTAVRPVDPVVILVAPVGRGRFGASSGGRVLVESSTAPFLDAARVLADEGVDPATRIVMRHEGKDYDAQTSTVATAARIDVKEGPTRFVTYTPAKTTAHASRSVKGSAQPLPNPLARQEALPALSPLTSPTAEAAHDGPSKIRDRRTS